MDILQKALECKEMAEEASNSLLQSTTQQRLLTQWCSWGCQPTSDGGGLDELFSVHSTTQAQLMLWGWYTCVLVSAVNPLPKGPSWQNGPPTQVIIPAAALECLLLQGNTRHMRSQSLTGDGSCGKLQWTVLFFNKLSISWVCVLRRHFYACVQIVGVSILRSHSHWPIWTVDSDAPFTTQLQRICYWDTLTTDPSPAADCASWDS